MTNNQVTKLFEQWNEALINKDLTAITELYAVDATLLPTVSNKVRHNHAEIKDYFIEFIAKEPKGELVEQNIRIFTDVAMNSGIYDFTFKDGTTVRARYSYVYQLIDNEWKIITHHSSQMPENI
jgi:uncharacterized protein (TIGR02246 family)